MSNTDFPNFGEGEFGEGFFGDDRDVIAGEGDTIVITSAPWPPLPPEGHYSDVERSFIENSPDGYWPDNQDSNFGQIRRVITDPLQDCVDFLSTLYFEMFVQTSTRYLGLWEELAGVATNPSDLSIDARRAIVLSVLKKGPFTRARRRKIVEAYILAGQGYPIMLVPEGVPIPPEGLPLFGEFDPTAGIYNIVETVETFYYSVRIRNGTPIDTNGLRNALNYFQPAGLHYTIDFVFAP